jgi:hypothetical protein
MIWWWESRCERERGTSPTVPTEKYGERNPREIEKKKRWKLKNQMKSKACFFPLDFIGLLWMLVNYRQRNVVLSLSIFFILEIERAREKKKEIKRLVYKEHTVWSRLMMSQVKRIPPRIHGRGWRAAAAAAYRYRRYDPRAHQKICWI